MFYLFLCASIWQILAKETMQLLKALPVDVYHELVEALLD